MVVPPSLPSQSWSVPKTSQSHPVTSHSLLSSHFPRPPVRGLQALPGVFCSRSPQLCFSLQSNSHTAVRFHSLKQRQDSNYTTQIHGWSKDQHHPPGFRTPRLPGPSGFPVIIHDPDPVPAAAGLMHWGHRAIADTVEAPLPLPPARRHFSNCQTSTPFSMPTPHPGTDVLP